MPSDAQKNKGYELPEQIDGHDLICVTLKIPNVRQYRAAFRAALKSLEEWQNWEKTGDTQGSQAAAYWRYLINEYLRFGDCDEWDILGNCDMGELDFCWFTDGDGNKILRWTTNGGCTWKDVGTCEDSAVIPPVVTIDPIDRPGIIPDPDDDDETACKMANTVFRRIYEEDASAFITSVLTGSVSGLGSRLITFLNAYAGGTGGAVYYTAWKPMVEKWYPHAAALAAAYDSAIYPENIQCVVVGCVPANGIIDKAVKDCIADGIEALTGVPYFTVGSGGYPPMQEYLVDFTNLVPLTYLRDQAFFVNGQPLESPCVECDGLPLPGGDCENRVITFDAPGEYTATIGVEGIGRTALGLKSINVPLGTFAAAPADWSAKVWGSRIIVPLEETGCTVKEIFFRQKSTTTPELNANTAVNVWMSIKGWLGDTLVHSSSGFNTVLYYNLATSWGRYGREINTPFVADSLEIEWFIGTPSSSRTWYQTVDDLEIVFG